LQASEEEPVKGNSELKELMEKKMVEIQGVYAVKVTEIANGEKNGRESRSLRSQGN
jgi:hypothetical protein